VLFVRVADRIGKGVRTAPRDALLADSVHADVRGLAYGVHRAADHTGAVIGPLLGWALLLAFAHNYRTVFAVALVPGIITMLVLLAGVRERRPPAPTATPGREPATLAAPPEARTANDRVFTRYLVVLVIFTLGNASDAFLLLHAQQTLGVADSAVLLLWSLHHVSKVVWSVVGGSLADRFGPRPAIVAGWFVYALTYALFAVAQSAWQAWALFLLYGLFFGLTEAPEKALVARLAPVRQRGSAFGAYHATIGFATLPASLLFGLLWQRFGVATAFFTGATLALIASVLLFLWVRPTETSGGAAA
jgi:MFS family permease